MREGVTGSFLGVLETPPELPSALVRFLPDGVAEPAMAEQSMAGMTASGKGRRERREELRLEGGMALGFLVRCVHAGPCRRWRASSLDRGWKCCDGTMRA